MKKEKHTFHTVNLSVFIQTKPKNHIWLKAVDSAILVTNNKVIFAI